MPIKPGLAMAIALLSGTAAAAEPLTGAAAFGETSADQPGLQRLIRPGDMPAPYASRSTASPAIVLKRPADVRPEVPEGFSVRLVAEGLRTPRTLRTAPNGDLFIVESGAGRIRMLPAGADRNGPAAPLVFAEGLERPYGLAFYPPGPEPRYLYVAETGRVLRFAYTSGDRKAVGAPELVLDGIARGGSHWTRDLAFSPDGKRLFVSVGSSTNVGDLGDDSEPEGGFAEWERVHGLGASWGRDAGRAKVLVADPDGGNPRPFANGLRNCSGLAVEPTRGALWCAVNERDGLGDNLPPDFASSVGEGAFYGWPWFYIGDHEDPRHKGARPDLASRVTVPDVLFQPHSAPLGIVFHTGPAFPPDYAGDGFVALHGSWNRGRPTGYKVVRLRMQDGRATGVYEDFMTGFTLPGKAVWGRPVGLAVGRDGALYVSEDGNGTIWRVDAN